MTYDQLIKEFAANLNMEGFEPDEDGVCQLIGDDTVITIQNCDEVGCVLVTSPVAELPVDASPELLRKLLGGGYLYEKTRGNSMSLDEENNIVVLSFYNYLKDLDTDNFVRRLENLAFCLDYWRKEINDTGLSMDKQKDFIPSTTNFIRP